MRPAKLSGASGERLYLRPTQCGAGRGAALIDGAGGQWRVRKLAALLGNAEGAAEGGG